MTCRICLEDGDTISVCGCSGTQGSVHLKCVTRWARQKQTLKCELCHQTYDARVTIEPEKPDMCLIATILVFIGICVSVSHSILVNALTCQRYVHMDLHLMIISTIVSGFYALCWTLLTKINISVSLFSTVCWYVIFFATSIPLQEHCGKFDDMGLWFSYVFIALFLMLLLALSVYIHHVNVEEDEPPLRAPVQRQPVLPVMRRQSVIPDTPISQQSVVVVGI